jgi:hypothetical protein
MKRKGRKVRESLKGGWICRCSPESPPFPACCRPDLLNKAQRNVLGVSGEVDGRRARHLVASVGHEATQGSPTHTNLEAPHSEAPRPLQEHETNTEIMSGTSAATSQVMPINKAESNQGLGIQGIQVGTPPPEGELGGISNTHCGPAPHSQKSPIPEEVRQALTAPLFVDPFSDIGPLRPIKDYRAKTRHIAAKYSEMALWGIIQTAQYSHDEKLRSESQKFLVTYGIGKPPVMNDEKTVEQNDSGKLSDEVLEQIARQADGPEE